MYVNRGTIPPLALTATALIAFIGLMSSLLFNETRTTSLRIVPDATHVLPGETFTVRVVVTSEEPVNVFGGEVQFDPNILAVDSISYNTSIADLWAEKPWYENGAGTVNFGGGTTEVGGFTGDGTLLTISFRAQGAGETTLSLPYAHIFLHDGLGTEAPSERIDALITVLPTTSGSRVAKEIIRVGATPIQGDLNDDGVVGIADTSMFMYYLGTQDLRGDLNNDGKVNAGDLSILLRAE